MSVTLRRLVIAVLGILAGIAAWPLMELILGFQEAFPSYLVYSLVQGVVFGAVLGAFFGSGEGLTAKEPPKIVRGVVTGLAAGVIGGAVGFLAGQGLLFFLLQRGATSFRSQHYVVVPLARVVGWAVLGLCIGVSEGIRAGSMKKSLIGAAGGVAGGLLGGAAIEYLRTLYPELLYTRLLGLVLFGLLIALFYSLLERSASLGVIHVLNGRRRGKEYCFAQNRMSAGSSRRNDIVLAGYGGVEDRHIRFRVRGRDVYVNNLGSTGSVRVNEEPIREERLLKYEDVIQFGSAKLFFKTE
jgi:CDP-diglyceride synthetase